MDSINHQGLVILHLVDEIIPTIVSIHNYTFKNDLFEFHSDRHCPNRNSTLCDSLCQSSLYQPDFRGRPLPGVTINPYISHSPPPMNFSARQHSSKKKQSYNMNFEDINRTYSTIY
jgi:hypothetical protein